MTDPNSAPDPQSNPTVPVKHTPEPDSTPGTAPSTAATLASEPKRRSRRRSILTVAGAAVGALVLVGGGIAVGAAIADEWDEDDDRAASQVESGAVDSGAAESGDGDDAADDRGATDSSSATGERGATSADEILRVIDAAAGVAGGEPTSIDAENGGAWDVTFHGPDGSETEVRVDDAGEASVVSQEKADADDTAPTGALDRETVDQLVTAALAHTDGTILGLQVDAGAPVSYDVKVRGADAQVVDLSLDVEFAIVSSDLDD